METIAKKEFKIRKVPKEEQIVSRRTMINMLSHSPDPYMSLLYTMDFEPSKALIKKLREKTGKRITFTHVINKIIALIIKENMAFNQVIFHNRIYELEEIHITNAYMIPNNGNTLTTIIIENPHEKSLEQIVDEFDRMKALKSEEYQRKSTDHVNFLSKVYGKTRLYKLMPEKKAFRISYERRIGTNIGITNLGYGGLANFIVIKPTIFFLRALLRIHVSGSTINPIEEDGKIVMKEVIPITVSPDHRILDGYHMHQFGVSLKRIASNPEKYL